MRERLSSPQELPHPQTSRPKMSARQRTASRRLSPLKMHLSIQPRTRIAHPLVPRPNTTSEHAMAPQWILTLALRAPLRPCSQPSTRCPPPSITSMASAPPHRPHSPSRMCKSVLPTAPSSLLPIQETCLLPALPSPIFMPLLSHKTASTSDQHHRPSSLPMSTLRPTCR